MPSESLISAQNVTHSTAHGPLFTDLSCALSDGSRVALVGANGAGKSTLLRILAKLIAPAEGDVIYRRGARVEYVPQFVPPELINLTVNEAIVQRLESVHRQDWEAFEILEKFGLTQLAESKLASVSGGEANRVLLASAVATNPDLILMDEPTNHMDSEAIIWFERLLKENLKIPYCIVSHDRELLDNCTNETLFLRDQRIYPFKCPYTEAVIALDDHDRALMERRQAEEKEIKRLEQSAAQLQRWAHLSDKIAPRYRAMLSRVERKRTEVTHVPRQAKREIGVADTQLRVQRALDIKGLDVAVGEGRVLYTIPEFSIAPGERVAILGKNGTGKTSFLRSLVANFPEPSTKSIRFNPQVTVGYYDQELRLLNPAHSLFQHLDTSTSARRETIVKELIQAGFPYTRHEQKIGTLSGGERARIQFLTLKLRSPSLLLLDEPTNHIDVSGIEDLETQLLDTSATCIFVSHDRRFVANVASRFFLIRAGKLVEIDDPREYYDSILSEAELPTAAPRAPKKVATTEPVQTFASVSAQIEEIEKRLTDLNDKNFDKDAATQRLSALYAALERLV